MIFAPASNPLVPWMQPQFGRGRASASPATYEALILSDNPVGYWRLGEPSGTTVVDSSTNSNNGLYSGSLALGQPGAISGDANTSVLFTGGLGTIPNISAYNFGTGDFSIETWIQTTASGFAIACSNYSGGNSFWIGLGSGFPTLAFTSGSLQSFTTAINDGLWRYLAGTRSSGACELYVDGVSVVSGSNTSDISSFGNLVIAQLGNAGFSSTEFLDEVAIYGYGLSSAQVLAHYNKGI